MAEALLEKVGRINARVGELLSEARQALRGECVFGVAQVRALSAQISEMSPVWEQAPQLRLLRPGMEGELDLYKSHLGDLQATLQQVHLMLLAQRAQMEADRAQLAAVGHWADMMQQTR